MKKKLLIFISVLIVFALLYTFDYFRAKEFSLEYYEITEQPSPADGKTEIEFIIKVTKDGEPIKGHDLFGIPYGSGGFKAYRVRTNEAGEAKFVYLPYNAHAEKDVKDIPFRIIDESNSVFIEVNSYYEGVLRFSFPTERTEVGVSLDDIFGITEKDKDDKDE